jgi:hypothetical protein
MIDISDSKELLQSEIYDKNLGLIDILCNKFKTCKPSLDALF